MAEQDDVLHLIDDSGTSPEASIARKWKVAVIDDRGRYTYQQLAIMTARTGASIASKTLRPNVGLLLPAGVGKVHEVTLTKVFGWRTSPMTKKGTGPYDGDYAVARDGGVGYVTVRVREKGEDAGFDPCAFRRDTNLVAECTSEKVPGVGLLSIRKSGPKADKESDGWMEARLVRGDGKVLLVQDWMGTRSGPGKEGPPLKTYPLTKAQLRQLALNPALLP